VEARKRSDHRTETRARWLTRRNRKQESPEYLDEWYAEQCGGCEFWIPLAAGWGSDYGVCSNPNSPLDGTVRLEHDGCEFFSRGDGWGVPEEF
jgi:hypothetical protein